MNTILTVTNEDLASLSPEGAVSFFSQLIWSEAAAIGLAHNLINIPSAINVADGGIDAEIRDAVVTDGHGMIKSGLTRYQIKTGEFNLSKKVYVNDILFKENKKELKPRVKSCLDNDGTLVIVLFGWDGPEKRDGQLISIFRSELEKVNPKYKDAKIEIWLQNNLISFIQAFPSLALKINGRSTSRFDTHSTWCNHDQMRNDFISGKSQSSVIEGIRTHLRRNDPETHIRILGEPGVGKTRMVLEATREPDLEPLVIYTNAESLIDSELLTEILRGKFQSILVIDECDADNRALFTNRLKHQCPRIQVISIYNDWENTSGITYFNAPPLSDTGISIIIQGYGVTKDQADRWADYCSGSPRVAHVVGFNLNAHPEDILKEPSSIRIWERYIAGTRNINSDDFRKLQLVLRYLALFRRFGYGAYLAQEAKVIAGLINNRNPDISQDRFYEIIQELRNRKILQGENTLYITPKLLHIKLWIDWWNSYGWDFDINALDLSPQLYDWFFEMFEYAAASKVASQKAKELLGNNGPFQNSELLRSRLGARFFYYLAKAEPQAALHCLQRTLGSWSVDDLRAFVEGRRDVIWALEYIAAWHPLFAGSARLILALAEAENESWGNNASGVFAQLFTISIDAELSRTEASPQERFPVLVETLNSSTKAKRLLGLKACEVALSTLVSGAIERFHNPLQKSPDLWKPKTWGDLYDAYSQVWNLVFSQIGTLPPDESEKAVKILTVAARGIAHYLELNEMVLKTLETLSTMSNTHQLLVVETVIHWLRYDSAGMPEEIKNTWEVFRDKLVGTDLHSRLKRYVGMDLIEDRVDEHGEITHHHDEIIKGLADEASQDIKFLLAELEWLLSTESPYAYNFGVEIALRDAEFLLLPELIHRLQTMSPEFNLYFIGGYLRVVKEKASDDWEELADSLAENDRTKIMVPELTSRSGELSERSAQRILGLLTERSIEPRHLLLLSYVHSTSPVSEATISKWIEVLLQQRKNHASSVALTIFANYYLNKDHPRSYSLELAFELVTNPGLVEITETPFRDQMAGFYWKRICNAIIQSDQSAVIDLARFILEHLSFDRSIGGGFSEDAKYILTAITKRRPNEMWNCVTSYIVFPMDGRVFNIKQWLRGSDFWREETAGAMSLMHPDDVWGWVEQDIENRARFTATCVPKMLFVDEQKICWAREILIRYGHREDVRNNLIANFSSEGWTGPTSLHLQNKINSLVEFLDKERNDLVRSWIAEYIEHLKQDLKHAQIEEERGLH